MSTVDHKRIGVMYLVGVLSAFLIGGMFALLVRLTLLTPSAHAVRQGADDGGDL